MCRQRDHRSISYSSTRRSSYRYVYDHSFVGSQPSVTLNISIGSNCNLIGFLKLVRELDFVLGKHHPTALSPDDLCPSDAAGDSMQEDWFSFGRDCPSSEPCVASDDSLFYDDESDGDDEF